MTPKPKTSPDKNPAAQALGRLGGSAGTAAQRAAARRNGKKGGRPGRICTSCGKPVKGGHEDRRLDDSCGAHGWRWSNGDDVEHDLLRDVLRVLTGAGPGDVQQVITRVRRALAAR